MIRHASMNTESLGSADVSAEYTGTILPEDHFNHVLSRERKRAERTGKNMLLLMLDFNQVKSEPERDKVRTLLSGPIAGDIRDTDVCGWLKSDCLLGIIFTCIPDNGVEQSKQTIELKVRECLVAHLMPAINEKIRISVLVFPENQRGDEVPEWEDKFSPLFYPELFQRDLANRIARCANRAMDIFGSIVALVLFSPFFLIVPILVKITSRGPVFFRQQRLGRYGKPFTFLKFRSMQINNDDSIHREYIKKFIDNNLPAAKDTESGEAVFKIQNDPRLTPIGNFLRKSSIDELPQFINVLKGEMSLVGPRPPIPYEVVNYGIWHWYRILARKPGITGLWQVKGRSLTTFDGMVRLDLHYIRTWSLWLDVKLLLATPMAVLRGKGAC